jgi:hypothetical protein
VTRSDLHGARPEFRLDALVLDDREPAADDRKQRLFPDELAVPLVAGMDCDCDVREHRRRPDGGDRDVAIPVR